MGVFHFAKLVSAGGSPILETVRPRVVWTYSPPFREIYTNRSYKSIIDSVPSAPGIRRIKNVYIRPGDANATPCSRINFKVRLTEIVFRNSIFMSVVRRYKRVCQKSGLKIKFIYHPLIPRRLCIRTSYFPTR